MYSGFELFIAFMLGGFTSVSIILVWLAFNLLKLVAKSLLDSIEITE